MNSKPSWGWLASAILFTVLMFFLLSWHVHYSYFIIENLQYIYINEDYRWHSIVDLSRQITAAARTVATDSNPDARHLEEYRKKVLELDALLPEENTLQSSNGDNDPLIQARSAHNTLRMIEQSALDQIRSGQRDIGLERLFDENHKIQEQLFLKAMNNFVDQSRHRLIDRLQNEKNKELQSLWAAFLVFLVSLSFWIMLIRRLQKWGSILSKEIHEHHKTEAIANTLERKYQNLFEYANDPIFIIDPMTYRLLDINQKAVDLLGYERDELLGLSLSDFILGDDQYSVEQILKILCSSDSTVPECTYRHKDGHPFLVEISGRLIDAGDREVYQCFVRDITERKRFQEERLHSQKIEAIGQVADGIAHDFRNALTAISGYNALCQDLLPECHPALESLKRIDQVIGQANGLVKGMLTFSRRQETERQSVEIRQLVENSADLFRRILPAAIALEIDTAPVQNFQVSADVTQLQQVLLNLMINARDAMPDGGTLRISLSPASADQGDGSNTAGWVRIEVSDTGVGMLPEVQARIFEPFFTTKPDEYGTGLGLAMVDSIVSQHGGRMEVRSAVGQGSTFTVLLPPATLDSTQDEVISSRNWKNGTGEMILLAEDHRYVREIMAATLRHVGYEVVQAEDGLALLDHYQAHRDRLRLVIADLDLPGCSGLDGLRQLRARGARLPAILITGTDSRDLSDQLDRETLLLRKPFQMATLARLVYSLLHEKARVDDQTHLDRSG